MLLFTSDLLDAYLAAGELTQAGALADELLRRGAELGWTGLAAPEEYDGAGQGLVELCLVAEELGRAAAPGAFTETVAAGTGTGVGGAVAPLVPTAAA